MSEAWKITLILLRQKGTEHPPYPQSFEMQVDPDEMVLDAVERVWAFHDRSLMFRHACHHSTCGACGMRVNGVEKLTCITTIRSVTHDGGSLKVEPLRNFPVVSDLVVDMSRFYIHMEQAKAVPVEAVNEANLPYEADSTQEAGMQRLVDCIECGCCISACPVALTTPTYLGPAVLAALQDNLSQRFSPELAAFADQADGVWRCHSAYECSAVCPSNVDPAWRIMDLRKRLISNRVGQFFGKKPNYEK